MKNILKFSSIFTLTFFCISLNAQNKFPKNNFFNNNINYQVKGQISIGGASPIGIPAQIRKIEKFQPKNILGIEVNVTKWLNNNKEFGIRTGLKFEGKGMETQARVKNYYTQIEDETGAQTKGYFTGHVVTEMKNTYLTIPILFVWNATDKWNFYGGFYISKLIDKSFKGHIYDGIFREGSPIGEPTTFEETAIGLYDFSNDLSPILWGNQLGAEYKLNQNFILSFDLTMANRQVFKRDFESISFKMYNIFGSLGIGYQF